MTCKDCIHYEACLRKEMIIVEGINRAAQYASKFTNEKIKVGCSKRGGGCEHFADRDRFVELPDDDVFRTVRTIDDLGRVMIPKRIRREQDIDYADKILFIPIGKSQILLSKFKGSQKVEQALREREKNAGQSESIFR